MNNGKEKKKLVHDNMKISKSYVPITVIYQFAPNVRTFFEQ